MAESGVSRQEMEAELKEIARAFAPFTGGKISVPSLRELESKGTAKMAAAAVDSGVDVQSLLTAYEAAESRISLDYTKKRETIQAKLLEGLKKIRVDAKAQRKKGKTKEEMMRAGDKKLQAFKMRIDGQLQALKKKGFKEFDKLKSSYKKKHPQFLSALEAKQRSEKRFRFAGKVLLGMTISFLVFILMGITVKALVFAFFLQNVLPEAAAQAATPLAETVGKGLMQSITTAPIIVR